MKNKGIDLNNYLFEQLERLNDDSLSAEELDKEIKKAHALTNIANAIIKNNQTRFNAVLKANEAGLIKPETTTKFLVNDLGQKNEKI